jgi:hypothetical protein
MRNVISYTLNEGETAAATDGFCMDIYADKFQDRSSSGYKTFIFLKEIFAIYLTEETVNVGKAVSLHGNIVKVLK